MNVSRLVSRLAALALAALLLLLAVPRTARAAAPVSVIPVTGQLLVGGSPATGNYDLQFQLYSAATGGTAFGPLVTVTNVAVEDGVFYAEVDFGNLNYGNPLYVQTSYRHAGTGTYTALSPRHVVPTVIYAANANYATFSGNTLRLQGTTVSGTAPTANQALVYSGTAWTPATLPAPTAYTAGAGLSLSSNKFSIASGGITSAMLGSGSVTSAALGAGSVTSTALKAGSVTAAAIAVPLALTSGALNGTLSVANTATASGSYDGIQGSTKGSSASGVAGFGLGTGNGLYGSSSNGNGVYGISGGGYGGYFTSGGTDGLYAESTAQGGNGLVGRADSGADAYGVYAISVEGIGVHASGGAYGLFASSGGPAVAAYGSGSSVSNPALLVNNSNASGIGIYSITNSTDANLVLTNAGTGDLIKAFNGGNNLYFEVKANGTTIVRQLQITGGADLAEPYTVGPADGVAPQAGMVVAIDPDHTGQMTLAHTAYDRTVAGILSGAGGIAPGLTLRQTGTAADGALPVACTGRVWCWCDAGANGAIRAGDLLTTSATPGHAMRATDDRRQRGAILGKAMSSLASGRGLVLVLVTLQ